MHLFLQKKTIQCCNYSLKSKISLRKINVFFLYCLEQNQRRDEESYPLLPPFGMNTFK